MLHLLFPKSALRWRFSGALTAYLSRWANDGDHRYKVDGDVTFAQWTANMTPEQKQAFEVHVKQWRNKAADKKRYERYIERLGTENVPKTFDLFQEKLYTDLAWKEEIEGFYRYKGKNPTADKTSYLIHKELLELQIDIGDILPPERIRAYILPDPDSKKDPYHIMHRMRERNITDDELRGYVEQAFVMQSQWGGKRLRYYSDEGICVISHTSEGWIYKTAWKAEDFDEDVLKIMEVIHKYV